MALRYRQLDAPTLIDTTPLETGNSQAAASLANAFKKFEGAALEPAAALVGEQGRQAGGAAGASPDFGKEGGPQFREGLRSLTAFGEAYNNSALRSYAVHAEADAEDQAARLEVEAGTDPEKFKATFGAIRDETLKHAPPRARAALDDIYTRRLSAGTARLYAAQATELRGQARADTAEGVQRSVDRIANLRASADPALALQADEEQAKLTMLIDGAHNDGTLSPVEWAALHIKSQRQVVAQTVSAKFQKELTNPYGDPVRFIERLKEQNKTSEALPPDEEDKLVAGLMADLREHNSLEAAGRAEDARAEKARYDAGDREAMGLLFTGQLTTRKLNDMVQAQQLEPAVARTLANELESGGVQADDPKVAFDVRTNLLSYTDDDIKTMPGLTWKTRGEMIVKRQEEAAMWKGTQAAREGQDRIDRALGIVPGTMVQALSDDEKRQRNQAVTQWYNEIDKLPPAERQQAVISTAEDVIGRFIRKNKSQEAQDLRSAKQRYTQGAGDPGEMGKEKRKAYDARLQRFDADISAAEAEAARK